MAISSLTAQVLLFVGTLLILTIVLPKIITNFQQSVDITTTKSKADLASAMSRIKIINDPCMVINRSIVYVKNNGMLPLNYSNTLVFVNGQLMSVENYSIIVNGDYVDFTAGQQWEPSKTIAIWLSDEVINGSIKVVEEHGTSDTLVVSAAICEEVSANLTQTYAQCALYDTTICTDGGVCDYSNFGALEQVYTGNNDTFPVEVYRALLQYDISSIPSYADVKSAKLLFYKYGDYDGGSSYTGNVSSIIVTEFWDEDTVSYSSNVHTDSDVYSGNITVIKSDAVGTLFQMDVQSIVTKWVNNDYPNYGFSVAMSSPDNFLFSANSSENPIDCVQLYIAYEPMELWPMFKYEPGRTSLALLTVPANNVSRWNYSSLGDMSNGIVAAKGYVIAASNDGNVYALNIQNGSSEWTYAAGDAISTTPAYYNNSVFFGSADNYFYSLDILTGEQRWNYSLSGIGNVSPGVTNNKVYTGSNGVGVGDIVVLNTDTGELNWSVTVEQVLSSPSMYNDYVYYAILNDSTVYVASFYKNNGTLFWKSEVPGADTVTTAAVTNNSVYFGSGNGYVYSLDITDGTQNWNASVGSAVLSSPAYYSVKIYFGTEDGTFYALTANTGTLAWSYFTGGAIRSSPAISSGRIFFGSDDSYVYAVSAFDGSLKWNYLTSGSVQSSPAIVNGSILVGSNDNKVYMIGNQNFVDNAPLIYNQFSNSTQANSEVGFNATLSDDVALSGYIFTFDNCTGTFVNDSWVELSGTLTTIQISKVLNSTSQCTIRWGIYVNDSSNQWVYEETNFTTSAAYFWYADSPWWQFQYGFSRFGFNFASVVPEENATSWNQSIVSRSQPVIHNGKVYVLIGGSHDKIAVIDETSGANTENITISNTWINDHPLFTDTGKLVFALYNTSSLNSSVVIYGSDHAYESSYDVIKVDDYTAAWSLGYTDGLLITESAGGVGGQARLSAVDVSSGEVVWSVSGSGTNYGSRSSFSADDDYVYVLWNLQSGTGDKCFSDCSLFYKKISISDGEEVNSFDTGLSNKEVLGHVLYDNGIVYLSVRDYASNSSYETYAYNEITGEQIWSYP